MELRARTVTLELAETFSIARSARDTVEVVHVDLEHEGVVGYGEGAPVEYWGETAETMLAFLTEEAPALVGDDPFAREAIGRRLAARHGGQAA